MHLRLVEILDQAEQFVSLSAHTTSVGRGPVVPATPSQRRSQQRTQSPPRFDIPEKPQVSPYAGADTVRGGPSFRTYYAQPNP